MSSKIKTLLEILLLEWASSWVRRQVSRVGGFGCGEEVWRGVSALLFACSGCQARKRGAGPRVFLGSTVAPSGGHAVASSVGKCSRKPESLLWAGDRSPLLLCGCLLG